MPVERQRLETLYGRTADLCGTDGSALVVAVGPVTDDQNGAASVVVTVLAVERRGTMWRFGPGDHGRVPLTELESVRPVVFLTDAGM